MQKETDSKYFYFASKFNPKGLTVGQCQGKDLLTLLLAFPIKMKYFQVIKIILSNVLSSQLHQKATQSTVK